MTTRQDFMNKKNLRQVEIWEIKRNIWRRNVLDIGKNAGDIIDVQLEFAILFKKPLELYDQSFTNNYFSILII